MRGSLNATPVPKVGAAALLGLVCALALAGPAAAGAAPEGPSGEITPGKGVGPITLGMSPEGLRRLWGPPQRTDRGQDSVDLYDYGEAQGVLVFLKEDRVAQLVVVTPAWSTPAGAKVGTPWPAVRAFLGQPDETLPGETQGESRYWYKQRGIAFILKDRTVTAIVVLAAVNEPASRGFLDDLLGIGRGRWEGKK